MGRASYLQPLISTLRHLIPNLLRRACELGRMRLLLLLLRLAQLRQVVEPRMLQRGGSGDSHLRPELEHAAEQVEADLVDLGEEEPQILSGVHLKVRLVLGELGDARPGTLRGRAHQPEDLLQLVLVGRAGEQGPAGVHLRHDAAGRPDVDARVVRATAEKHIRRTVPEGHHFVGEGVDGNTECAGQTEVCKLQLAASVDEEILRLQVAVQDAVVVAEGDATEELVHEGLDRDVVQLAAIAARIHVFLQVLVHVLEYEHELVFGMDDIVQGDNVLMLELLHQRDLPYGSRWGAFLRVKVDLLQRHKLARLTIPSFENLRHLATCCIDYDMLTVA